MNLPAEFVERTRKLMGEKAYNELETALQGDAPVSIRVNRAKCLEGGEGKSNHDTSLVADAESVPWSSMGVYLSRRPTFTFDPLFHAGCYYVQEASSMFVEQVLRTYISISDLLAAAEAAGVEQAVCSICVRLPEGSPLMHVLYCRKGVC